MTASVGANSDGAADNASGVAAVLAAASLVSPDRSFGILITDAEELSLAGATAWVGGRDKGIAVNCDTLDDSGEWAFLPYGAGRRPFLERASNSFARTMAPHTAATPTGVPLTRPAAPAIIPPWAMPGVLTDSNAFRAAGWETVTLGRGTLRTLGRIHTKRDSLDSMRGTSIPDAARILAGLIEDLA
jgi:hypothetical protein